MCVNMGRTGRVTCEDRRGGEILGSVIGHAGILSCLFPFCPVAAEERARKREKSKRANCPPISYFVSHVSADLRMPPIHSPLRPFPCYSRGVIRTIRPLKARKEGERRNADEKNKTAQDSQSTILQTCSVPAASSGGLASPIFGAHFITTTIPPLPFSPSSPPKKKSCRRHGIQAQSKLGAYENLLVVLSLPSQEPPPGERTTYSPEILKAFLIMPSPFARGAKAAPFFLSFFPPISSCCVLARCPDSLQSPPS